VEVCTRWHNITETISLAARHCLAIAKVLMVYYRACTCRFTLWLYQDSGLEDSTLESIVWWTRCWMCSPDRNDRSVRHTHFLSRPLSRHLTCLESSIIHYSNFHSAISLVRRGVHILETAYSAAPNDSTAAIIQRYKSSRMYTHGSKFQPVILPGGMSFGNGSEYFTC
jgi:hypothetical protein